MKLNSNQLTDVLNFVKGFRPKLPPSLLRGIELKVGLLPPVSLRRDLPLGQALELSETTSGPVFVEGTFGPRLILEILTAFRDGVFPFLLVRIEDSWQCLIRCNGEILERTCSEEKTDTVECCDVLREECGRF